MGYDLTSIQSIAAWVNAGFGNQAFTVDVKLIGASDYTPLATVDYQPLALDGIGATKVTLTDRWRRTRHWRRVHPLHCQ